MDHSLRTVAGRDEESFVAGSGLVAGDIRPEDLPGYSRIRLFNAMIEFGEIDLPVDKIVL